MKRAVKDAVEREIEACKELRRAHARRVQAEKVMNELWAEREEARKRRNREHKKAYRREGGKSDYGEAAAEFGRLDARHQKARLRYLELKEREKQLQATYSLRQHECSVAKTKLRECEDAMMRQQIEG